MSRRKEEEHMNGYTIKPNMPFVTSKELKSTKASQKNVDMVKFMDAHKFSLHSENGKFVTGVSKKHGI